MSRRAAVPWNAVPVPGIAQPGGCGLIELVTAETCEFEWQVSQKLTEWQRWHDAGSARSSTEWRPRKSSRWTKRRSGRSTSFTSMGTEVVLPWQSRQKFWSWQLAHVCCADLATFE